jgi:hypothetical protein
LAFRLAHRRRFGAVARQLNLWYYHFAFVALVFLLTRSTRLPDKRPTAFFYDGQGEPWRK